MRENDGGEKPTSSNELWGEQQAMDCRMGRQETRVSGERPETVRYASLPTSQRCRNWYLPP